MKRLLLLSITLAACAHSAGTASNKGQPRTVEACEGLLKHTLKAEEELATVTLDDHKYTRRKVEKRYQAAYEEIRKNPAFLSECRALTDAQYACVMGSPNLADIAACTAPPGSARPAQQLPDDIIPIEETPSG